MRSSIALFFCLRVFGSVVSYVAFVCLDLFLIAPFFVDSVVVMVRGRWGGGGELHDKFFS